MKKVLVLIAACFLSFAIMAAEQYDRINPNRGAGITVKADSSVVLSFIKSNGNAASFLNSSPSGYNMFGYYTLDANNNVKSWGQIDLKKLVDGKINIGNFKEGDTIAFWAANGDGQYIDSMHSKTNGEKRSSAYVGNNGNDDNVVITMGSVSQKGNKPEKLAGIDDTKNYIFGVSTAPTVNPPPMGQPLPGFLPILWCALGIIIGGGLVAFFRGKKRECAVNQD